MNKIIENVKNNFYKEHPQGMDLLKLDLSDLIMPYEVEISDLDNAISELYDEISTLEDELNDIKKINDDFDDFEDYA